MGALSFVIDRGEQVHTAEAAKAIAAQSELNVTPLVEDEEPFAEETQDGDDFEGVAEGASEEAPLDLHAAPEAQDSFDEHRRAHDAGGEDGHRRRRRRGGRGRGRQRRDNGHDVSRREPRAAAGYGHEHSDDDAQAHEDAGADAAGAAAGAEAGYGQPNGVSGDSDPNKRRRRRGRRGGRRNRQSREMGQENGRTNGGDNGAPQYGNEQPFENEAYGDEASFEQPPAPPEAPPAIPPTPPYSPPIGMASPPPVSERAEQSEAPRRSTVREPASFAREASATAPSTEPVVSSTSNAETAPPKRGWWGKRLLGDKS
jgi:ribonuclease E